MKCSPWNENGVHLQQMLALEEVVSLSIRCKVISIGLFLVFNQIVIVQMVLYMLKFRVVEDFEDACKEKKQSVLEDR